MEAVRVKRASKKLLAGKWKCGRFNEFDLKERGKMRHIHAVSYDDRVVQRSLCDNALIPILSRHLIYDNGASMKDKGTDFALDRFEHHLRQHFRLYGMNGVIYTFDFSDYFHNVDTAILKRDVLRIIPESPIMDVYRKCIGAYRHGGLGLGAQVSQISAIFFPSKLDHYIKDQLGLNGFGRFMDDGYVICRSKEEAVMVAKEIERICNELHIVLNRKKCQFIKFGKPVRFLKVRFFINKNGEIVRKVNRSAITLERKRLRGYKRLCDKGEMTFEEANLLFHAWLCSLSRGKSFNVKKNMIGYFNKLFGRNYEMTVKSRKKHHDLRYLERILCIMKPQIAA